MLLAVAAFVSRIAYLLLAVSTLINSFRGRDEMAIATSLAASACLIASSALSASDAYRLIPLGIVCALLLVTHLLVKSICSDKQASTAFLPYVTLLISTGMCLILDVQTSSYQGNTIEFVRYALYAAVGLVAYVGSMAASQRNVSLFSAHANYWFAFGVCLLAITLVIGTEANGAQSWIKLFGNLSVQPSEFAKIALVIAASAYLAANSSRLDQYSLRGVVPIALAFAASLGTLALQKDLGCALVLYLTLCSMIACSTKRGWVYLILMLLCAVALIGVSYVCFDHVRVRFDVWQNPMADPLGIGYQYLVAMKCLFNGGLLGCGLGNGLEFANLPVAESDYIYAVLCEELGIAGCLVVLMCYFGLTWKAMNLAMGFPRASFERNVVAGIGALVSIEALLIIAGVVNLIPLTGIAMPLMSRGGSCLVATLVGLGIATGVSCNGIGNEAEIAEGDLETKGTLYETTRIGVSYTISVFSNILKLGAPTIISLALGVGLCACLGFTVKAQLAENGTLRACGVTKHQNLKGDVVTSDGVVLATDQVNSGEKETAQEVVRNYPQGNLACHIIGTQSDGIEAQVNLRGTSTVANLLAIPEQGDDIVLTIDSRIQLAAETQLEGVTGAIVVIDPKTGRVLAMASSPTYDLTGDVARTQQSYFNRATLGQYSPGSTFKLVTLATALETGASTPESRYDAPSSITYGNEDVITNYHGNAYGNVSLTEAMNLSANTVFAQVGEEIGADTIIQFAKGFGFNQPLEFCIGANNSAIANLETKFQTAWAACGEPQDGSKLYASPLQMALCMCAIANDGIIMQPYLIEGRKGKLGGLYERTETFALYEPISSDTAQKVRDILQQNDAPSTWCPYDIYGKTGTAENDNAPDNAWYVCAAQREGATVVVVCIVEQGGTGASAAMPRAAKVATAAIDAVCAKA